MTISQSLEIMRPYVRHLEYIDDHAYAKDPVSGEVKLANPYADLIDAMHTAIDCMELFDPLPESLRKDRQSCLSESGSPRAVTE